jgi:hypothetical protein
MMTCAVQHGGVAGGVGNHLDGLDLQRGQHPAQDNIRLVAMPVPSHRPSPECSAGRGKSAHSIMGQRWAEPGVGHRALLIQNIVAPGVIMGPEPSLTQPVGTPQDVTASAERLRQPSSAVLFGGEEQVDRVVDGPLGDGVAGDLDLQVLLPAEFSNEGETAPPIAVEPKTKDLY